MPCFLASRRYSCGTCPSEREKSQGKFPISGTFFQGRLRRERKPTSKGNIKIVTLEAVQARAESLCLLGWKRWNGNFNKLLSIKHSSTPKLIQIFKEEQKNAEFNEVTGWETIRQKRRKVEQVSK